jgi:hypothetical protein
VMCDVQMLVGARWPAAVKALSMAMLMEVIFAPSMRSKAMRWHAASTMAMSVGGDHVLVWILWGCWRVRSKRRFGSHGMHCNCDRPDGNPMCITLTKYCLP